MTELIQNADRQRAPDTLKQQIVAEEIYAYLRAKKDIAELSSFGKGHVTFPDSNRTIEVSLNPYKDTIFQELSLERGFSKKEIKKGIIILIERRPKRSLKHIALANKKIHAITIQDDGSSPNAELTQEELDAIYVVATLSAIPGRIFDTFGSFENFKKMIKNPDMKGITSLTPLGTLLYDAGLNQYVEGIGLMRKGKMDAGTSDRRAVMGTSSADRSRYYEEVTTDIAAINKTRQTSL